MSNIITNSFNRVLLKLNIENKVNNFNNLDFSNNFIKVKYILNDSEYTSKITNKTTSSMTSYIYLDVDKEIMDASSIWLEITVRNKKYKYVLK